ncbi:MAG: aspartate aminotransferase family protein [Myxococcota bacterium]|nr:aspartate aminotransferase family protein [Myxococcota bacterium]
MSMDDVRKGHDEFLFPCVANYYEEPLVLTEAKGSWAKDSQGEQYLDFFGGILTVSLGHCQDEITEAVTKQMQTLGHVSTLYQTSPMVDVARHLAELTPGPLKKSFFTNSGTEADETAVLLARIHTGNQEIIALRHGYHGRSNLSMNLTGHSSWRASGSTVPGIKHAHAPYCYRCPFGAKFPSCGIKCAQDLEELIQTETSGKVAALLAEPILGLGGYIEPPKEYFEVAVGIVRNYGGVFICDEVQTGFGRTGEHWFGIEHHGVEPEIMTMAKGIANGMPAGVTVATDEVANSFSGKSTCTFGGNPVSMAATNATLSVMVRENIPNRASILGATLRGYLMEMKEKYGLVGDVRGKGLMQGIELVKDRKSKEPAVEATTRLMEVSKKEKLLIGRGGLYGNVIRLAPPMLIEEEELIEGCRRLDRALSEVCGNE